MADFDADKLGKRLDELNREQLAAIELRTEELLLELRRAGPMRAEPADAPSLRPRRRKTKSG